MVLFGDGLAAGLDLENAATEAVEQAIAPLTAPPSVVCVFVSGGDPDAAERAGRAAMAAASQITGERSVASAVGALATGADTRPAILGCTASGVIGAGRGVENAAAVSAWAAVLPGAQVTPFLLESTRAGDGLVVTGMPVPAGDDRIGVLFADPYRFPADAFISQSASQLGGLPIAGGLADGPPGMGAEAVRLYLDGEVYEGGAVGVLIGGQLEVATVVSQGCRPVGPSMAVTAASGNQVAELAGAEALVKLEEIVSALPLHEQGMVGEGLHIGIAMDEYADQHERGDFLIRSVIGADPQTGALTIGDVVEVGQTVRFQVRDAVTAAADLDQMLAAFCGLSGIRSVGGVLLFSCNGRGEAFFGTADHDVEAVRRALAPEAVGGFFAAGEIGPIGGRNHIHGFTASIIAFGAGTEN